MALVKPILRRPANIPASRNGSAWHEVTDPARPRMIVAAEGGEKEGKDHFALTADGPIYIHSFDWGLDGVVQKFSGKKKIKVADYKLEVQPGQADEQTVAESADRLWGEFYGNFRDSLASTAAEGLVLVDTESETWELMRLARFGKLSEIMPHFYTKVNAEYRNFIRLSEQGNNVCFLRKMKDEWENYIDPKGREKGRRTGKLVATGFRDMRFLAQVNVRCERIDLDSGGSEFQITVTDCRQNPSVNGMVMENDWNLLLAMVFAE